MAKHKKNKQKWVRDELSQQHQLTKELGKGGQGIVYKTKDPDLLVKIPLKNFKEITASKEVERYQRNIERINLLPLTEKMHITRPLYLLAEQAGYVMQMMQDMQPIAAWLPQKFSSISKKDKEKFTYPTWLDKEVPIASAYELEKFAELGGVKRRLELLAQAAIELLRLHSVGLVYMDISDENIFVSSNPEYTEAWLIDADNLRFEVENTKVGMVTPGYGAPEIVKGESGSRIVSDAYSFALLAFKILTMSSAFAGKLFTLQDDDWADDDENKSAESELSLNEQADRGLLPFIFDAHDNSNSQVNGLPHHLVVLVFKFFLLIIPTNKNISLIFSIRKRSL